MALALRELQVEYDSHSATKNKPSLADFNYNRKDMAEQLMAKISALRFQGASGLVSFSGADRIGTTALFQIQSKRALLFLFLILALPKLESRLVFMFDLAHK